MTKSTVPWGFGHIYWRNLWSETSFSVQCILSSLDLYKVVLVEEKLHPKFLKEFTVSWKMLWRPQCDELHFILMLEAWEEFLLNLSPDPRIWKKVVTLIETFFSKVPRLQPATLLKKGFIRAKSFSKNC